MSGRYNSSYLKRRRGSSAPTSGGWITNLTGWLGSKSKSGKSQRQKRTPESRKAAEAYADLFGSDEDIEAGQRHVSSTTGARPRKRPKLGPTLGQMLNSITSATATIAPYAAALRFISENAGLQRSDFGPSMEDAAYLFGKDKVFPHGGDSREPDEGLLNEVRHREANRKHR